MKKLVAVAGLGLVGLAISTTGTSAVGAGSVSATKDDCADAWAILFSTNDKSGNKKEMVKRVVAGRGYWRVGDFERGRSQHFELLTANVKDEAGLEAHIAHCGHGATCNELSREILRNYPDIGSPVVFCQPELPIILDGAEKY